MDGYDVTVIFDPSSVVAEFNTTDVFYTLTGTIDIGASAAGSPACFLSPCHHMSHMSCSTYAMSFHEARLHWVSASGRLWIRHATMEGTNRSAVVAAGSINPLTGGKQPDSWSLIVGIGEGVQYYTDNTNDESIIYYPSSPTFSYSGSQCTPVSALAASPVHSPAVGVHPNVEGPN